MLVTISVIATPVPAALRAAHPALSQNLDILPKYIALLPLPVCVLDLVASRIPHPTWQTLSVQHNAPSNSLFSTRVNGFRRDGGKRAAQVRKAGNKKGVSHETPFLFPAIVRAINL